MENLLGPCPFCEDRNPVLHAHDGWAQVECEACGAHGPVFGDENTSLSVRKEQARNGWNTGSRR